MRLELPNLNTRVDVFVGPNPDATAPYYYWDFTLDAAAQFLQVVVIAGGGGGGSGMQGATGTVRGGGQGGAGGGYNTGFYPAYMLDPTGVYLVRAGVGGVGGTAQDSPDTDGNAGGDGGNSRFHNLIQVEGGVRGDGGHNFTYGSAYRPGDYNTPWKGGSGGLTLTGRWHNGENAYAGGGGGGGGWVDDADTVYAGGYSGMCVGLQSRTGLATAGQDGENQPATWPLPSCGGGGGSDGGNGGKGGAYGGGGGGGGASTNGTPSGAGGDGAPGIVICTSYF